MSHKLILIAKSKGILTPCSQLLIRRILDLNLINRVPNRSTEFLSWSFSKPYLSVRVDESVRIIENTDDIITYLECLPPARITPRPSERLFF